MEEIVHAHKKVVKLISHEIMRFRRWDCAVDLAEAGAMGLPGCLWCAVSFGQWHRGKRGESKKIARHPVRIWRTGVKRRKRERENEGERERENTTYGVRSRPRLVSFVLRKAKMRRCPGCTVKRHTKATKQATRSFPLSLCSHTPSLFSRFFTASVRRRPVLDVGRGSREGCVWRTMGWVFPLCGSRFLFFQYSIFFVFF